MRREQARRLPIIFISLLAQLLPKFMSIDLKTYDHFKLVQICSVVIAKGSQIYFIWLLAYCYRYMLNKYDLYLVMSIISKALLYGVMFWNYNRKLKNTFDFEIYRKWAIRQAVDLMF